MESIRVPRKGRGRPRQGPQRLIADESCDSGPVRKRLKALKIGPIAPHRRHRRMPKTQDGRKLRRYGKRWQVERTLAWLGNFRRLMVRHARHILMYRVFFHLACLIFVLNRF